MDSGQYDLPSKFFHVKTLGTVKRYNEEKFLNIHATLYLYKYF